MSSPTQAGALPPGSESLLTQVGAAAQPGARGRPQPDKLLCALCVAAACTAERWKEYLRKAEERLRGIKPFVAEE